MTANYKHNRRDILLARSRPILIEMSFELRLDASCSPHVTDVMELLTDTTGHCKAWRILSVTAVLIRPPMCCVRCYLIHSVECKLHTQ